MKFLYMILAVNLPMSIMGALRGRRKTAQISVHHHHADGSKDVSHHDMDGENPPPDPPVHMPDGWYDYCPNPTSLEYIKEEPLGTCCEKNSDCTLPGECCLVPRCICGTYHASVPDEACKEGDEKGN